MSAIGAAACYNSTQMLRQKLMSHHRDDGFRWRGAEVARIEGLSDAVFAFAVTLLIVSLEVPKTFDELMAVMRGFLAFAICFALLLQVWHEQYRFFRRYNLQDSTSLLLNCILLFLVLFYVYPLKFLFTFLVNMWMGFTATVQIKERQVPLLMGIFSGGFLAVSCIFMLLFGHALRKRDALELNGWKCSTRKSASELRRSTVLLPSPRLPSAGLRRFGGAASLALFIQSCSDRALRKRALRRNPTTCPKG